MDKLLELLEQDCSMTTEQLATIAGMSEADVKAAIHKYEEERVILGYKAIIDWDRVHKEAVTALIEVNVVPQSADGFDRIADLQRLQQLHAVRVLVAGDGERDGSHAVFWVIGVTENRSNHHVISSVFLSRFKTTSPYLHSRSAPRMSRKALSLTSSEKARSSITMLSPPTEMVFAA